MRIEDLRPSQTMALYLGAVVVTAALAIELERLELSDQGDSLIDAQKLRPLLLEAVEEARCRGH